MGPEGTRAGLAPALGFVGCFSFVMMLMFLPQGLGLDAGGACRATGAMALAAVTVAAVASVSRGPWAPRVLGALSAACVACALVAHVTDAGALPVWARVALMGAACVAQLYLAGTACSGMRLADVAAGTLLALLAASALNCLCVVPFLGGSDCVVFQATLLLVSACSSFVAGDGAAAAAPGSADDPGGLRGLAGALAQVRHDWVPLAGSAVSAAVFGLVTCSGGLGLGDASLAYSFAGTVVAALALAAAALAQRRGPDGIRLPHLALAAMAVGALVEPVCSLASGSPVSHMLSWGSQTAFLGLLFVETQLTGRELPRKALLLEVGVLAFLLMWLAGAAASAVVSQATAVVVAHVLFVACLCVLVARLAAERATARAAAEAADAPRANLGELVRVAGAGVSEEFGLSRREAEVLPMLVLGLTASGIAERLCVSPQTVKSYTHRVYTKLGVHSHSELVTLFESRR